MPSLQLNRTLASLATLLLFSLPAMAANPLQVKTDKGTVEGAYTTDHQVIAFKGIPYAAPPVGDLRWKPPMPAAKWTGVRSATDFGSHCVQSGGYPRHGLPRPRPQRGLPHPQRLDARQRQARQPISPSWSGSTAAASSPAAPPRAARTASSSPTATSSSSP